MLKSVPLLVVLLMGVASGCDGDTSGGVPTSSGVDGNKFLDELTADEIATLCEWSVRVQGGPGERKCGENTTVEIPSIEECRASSAELHCKVSLAEACVRDVGSDVCKYANATPPSCVAYVQCAISSGGG